ncbi:cyclase family protein [Polaromonas hydrogenivorans]|uniref:Cyclase family protein n=1 Tax=Polaromonas hydrogenivorans TaxID=335476 RepID=A0AAU7M000_9BURK
MSSHQSSTQNYPTTLSGALRFIDKAAVARGMAAVKRYEAISLGMPIVHGGGPIAPLRSPTQHYMRRHGGDYATGAKKEVDGFGFSDDVIMLSTHGTTHVDALCHVFCCGHMFGGIPASEVSSSGSRHLGAETIPAIATRAIVVDAVPEGTQWLAPGHGIPAARLQALIDAAGLTVEPGDALIVRTGSLLAYRHGEAHDRSWPGLGADCVEWVKEKKISLIGADNIGVEVIPSQVPGVATPLHSGLMFAEGVLFIELMDLEAVAGKTFEAMLTVNPLRIVGGTASPLAPMLLL